jgi:Spy/CpxP family protein refolding chaperone
MMRKLPWILLAVSITFNFAFTGGLLEAQSARQEAAEPEQTPGDKAQLVADKLGLTGEQREAYIDARTRLSREGAKLREAMALAREERRAELAKAAPDLARVAQIEADIADLACQMRLLAAEHLKQFAGRLGPDQRRRLSGMMHRRSPRGGKVPPMLKRFDTDGDGKLSEQERKAARRHFHEARPGWGRHPRTRSASGAGNRRPAPREEMLRRFDADGDGVLNDSERAELMRARRQRGPTTRPAAGSDRRRQTSE